MPRSPQDLHKSSNPKNIRRAGAVLGDDGARCAADVIGPRIQCGCALHCGQIVNVRFGREHARFLVTWVGEPGTPQEGHVGLQSMRAGRRTWDVTLAREAIHSRETARLQLRLVLIPTTKQAGRN